MSGPSRTRAGHEVPDPMRADVRLLGELLGQVLREYPSAGLFEDVERLRGLVIRAVEDPDGDDITAAEQLVASFAPGRAEEVAQAFTCYFLLTNLAEERQRVRTLRARDGAVPVEEQSPADSVAAALHHLGAEVGAEEAQRRLAALEFRPVLTAHPTEARRRAVSAAVQRIAALLAEQDDPRRGPGARAAGRRRLLAEVDVLWRTAQLRSGNPSPLDEVRTALGVFEATLVDVLPEVYRRLEDHLAGEDAGRRRPAVPALVHLGSWIGADRDGNPNVTARVTRAAAAAANQAVLRALAASARDVAQALSLDARSTPPSPELVALWGRQRRRAEDRAAEIAARAPNEPHRHVMGMVAERITATARRDADLAYPDAAALRADLDVVQGSLEAAGAPRAAFGDLQRLRWQVDTFGFHLAELEVRQHSAVHAQTLAWLRDPGSVPSPAVDPDEVLEVFRAMAAIQARYGVDACRRYIVSFTRTAADIAAVHELARHAVPDGDLLLDVIPLFETFQDLKAAPDVLEEMLALEPVQRRLAATGRRMEVMLGYSDSAKDVGPVAANLALYEAQERLVAWGRENGVALTLFHGRGGALGRGGGPANRAVLAQPPGSVDLRFKLTEQGEVILARYGDRDIAARHVEQVTAATLMASAPSVEARNAEAAARYAGLATRLTEVSRARFDELVHADGFPRWFAQVTPQEEIGLLALGSRPARRGLSVESLDDLRAIPWNFAWSQARINLTGWFGLGTALEAVGDTDLLRRAYAQWPLLTTLVDNVEMSLAKTDPRIARRYLGLGDRPELADLVMTEHALTTRWVLELTGHGYLLEGHHVLGRAVQLRNPYVDALSLLQLRALRALRLDAEDLSEEQVAEQRRLLLLTLKGVAAGLQNTG